MGKLTLILGGARSGKSSFGERLAGQRGERVAYIATAQALDDEMAERITMHKNNRPAGWHTLEIPRNVGLSWTAQNVQADVALLDCITLLVTNILLETSPDVDAPDAPAASARVEAEIEQLLEAIRGSQASWIVVSNEVGMGLVPPYPSGRVYRDLLGWANQQLAAEADEVFFMLAGIPMRLTPV
jgi:adenosylcobinamide kinase/adenosylcobinamide-phosphate guanylyltransferase